MKVVTTTGDMFDVKGYRSVFLNMRTNGSIHQAKLTRAVYVPKISYYSSLMAAIVMKAQRGALPSSVRGEGKVIFFPHRPLNCVYASRMSPPRCASAVIVPGNMPVPQYIEIDLFHAAYGHVHECLLLGTVKDGGMIHEGRGASSD